MDLRGKRVLVVGMAASGTEAALFLRDHGALVVISELRSASEVRTEIPRLLEAGVAIETGGHRERSFLDADLIVVSPGVPAQMPLLERARALSIPVLAEIELAYRFLRGTLVAITGANGKTTTTSLAGAVIAACGRHVQVGGNIGTPFISLASSSTPETVNVMEVSSFQLETIDQFRPHVAAVLNLSPDHLDRHGTMEAYAAAKQRIFRNQDSGDFAVLNQTDAWCRRFAETTRSQVCWFGPPSGAGGDLNATVANGQVVWNRAGRSWPILPVADIPLRGGHNLENVLAAVAIGCLIQGVGTAAAGPGRRGEEACRAIGEAVRGFKAVEHRLEFVANVGGVDYYNDSKATNVDATLKALDAFSSGVWLILGGKDKGSDYTALLPAMEGRVRRVLLIGAATEKIAAQLGTGPIPLERAGTLERALGLASSQARSGDTVLLAPACASFDQFRNYQHRGRVFKELVERLAAPVAAPR